MLNSFRVGGLLRIALSFVRDTPMQRRTDQDRTSRSDRSSYRDHHALQTYVHSLYYRLRQYLVIQLFIRLDLRERPDRVVARAANLVRTIIRSVPPLLVAPTVLREPT